MGGTGIKWYANTAEPRLWNKLIQWKTRLKNDKKRREKSDSICWLINTDTVNVKNGMKSNLMAIWYKLTCLWLKVALIGMRNWLKMAVMKIGFIVIAIWGKSNVCSYTIRPFVMLGCWYDRMVNYRCGRMWTMRWPTDRRYSTRWTWRSSTTRRKMTAFLEVVHKGIISWSIVILMTPNDSCTYYVQKYRNNNLASHFSTIQTFINNNKLKLCCRWYDYTFTFHCTQYSIYHSLVDSHNVFHSLHYSQNLFQLVHSYTQATITFHTFVNVYTYVCLS